MSEVLQAAFQLADTVARGAAQEDILFFERTLANGAGFWGTDRFGLRGALGEVDGDNELTACDEEGETREGDVVDSITPITWVEVIAE